MEIENSEPIVEKAIAISDAEFEQEIHKRAGISIKDTLKIGSVPVKGISKKPLEKVDRTIADFFTEKLNDVLTEALLNFKDVNPDLQRTIGTKTEEIINCFETAFFFHRLDYFDRLHPFDRVLLEKPRPNLLFMDLCDLLIMDLYDTKGERIEYNDDDSWIGTIIEVCVYRINDEIVPVVFAQRRCHYWCDEKLLIKENKDIMETEMKSVDADICENGDVSISRFTNCIVVYKRPDWNQ